MSLAPAPDEVEVLVVNRTAWHSIRVRNYEADLDATLVEERLLGLQLLAERKAWVAVHDSLQAARARRSATHVAIAVARLLAGCWKFKVERLKFTDRRCRRKALPWVRD